MCLLIEQKYPCDHGHQAQQTIKSSSYILQNLWSFSSLISSNSASLYLLRLHRGFCEIYLPSRVHKFHKFATIFPFLRPSLSRAAFKKCLLKNRQARDWRQQKKLHAGWSWAAKTRLLFAIANSAEVSCFSAWKCLNYEGNIRAQAIINQWRHTSDIYSRCCSHSKCKHLPISLRPFI
jgi:hypothetical protein